MNKISFADIGAVTATFMADGAVKGGQVVKITDSGKVGPCADNEKFCGVALNPRLGAAAVQVKGFVEVPCSGSITPGWAVLAADGKGGVKAASAGVTVLVVSAQTDGTAVLCL